jgi:hypothetical protein
MRVLCRPYGCLLPHSSCVMRFIRLSITAWSNRFVCGCLCVRGGGGGAWAVFPLSYVCTYVPGVAYIVVSGLYVYRETSVITSRASLKLTQSTGLHGTTRAVVFQILCQNTLYYSSENAVAACQFWLKCNGASMYLIIQQLCHILGINHIPNYESNPFSVPVAYRGIVWGVQQPPPPRKFRSFDNAEPNSQFRGKYIRNNLIRIRVSLICKLSVTPD